LIVDGGVGTVALGATTGGCGDVFGCGSAGEHAASATAVEQEIVARRSLSRRRAAGIVVGIGVERTRRE